MVMGKIYYERIGEGRPVICLHGNQENRTIFYELANALKDEYQMILIDKTISRQHAVILKGRKKDHYEIRDLGSTNGTWLKGIPVNTDHADSLEDGDVVGFAQKKYRFIVRKDVL